MFDLGWSKLVLIAIVALVVIGPKELPAVMRTMGQWMAKIRRMAAEFQGQFQEAMREAEMAELKQHIDQIHDAAKDLTSTFNPTSFNPLETARSEMARAIEGSPTASAATPADTTSSAGAPPPPAEPTPAPLAGEPTPAPLAVAPEPAPSPAPPAPPEAAAAGESAPEPEKAGARGAA